MDPLIQQEIQNGKIKLCPHCSAPGELMSGCNYIKCPLCNNEWCFLCNLPKYKPISDQKDCCNDKTHNSH